MTPIRKFQPSLVYHVVRNNTINESGNDELVVLSIPDPNDQVHEAVIVSTLTKLGWFKMINLFLLM